MSSPWFARLPRLHPHLLPVWCSLTHLADPVWPDHVNFTIKFSKYCTVDNSNSPQLSVLQNYWNVSPSFLRSWFHLDSQIEASYTRGNTCVTMCTYRPWPHPRVCGSAPLSDVFCSRGPSFVVSARTMWSTAAGSSPQSKTPSCWLGHIHWQPVICRAGD